MSLSSFAVSVGRQRLRFWRQQGTASPSSPVPNGSPLHFTARGKANPQCSRRPWFGGGEKELSWEQQSAVVMLTWSRFVVPRCRTQSLFPAEATSSDLAPRTRSNSPALLPLSTTQRDTLLHTYISSCKSSTTIREKCPCYPNMNNIPWPKHRRTGQSVHFYSLSWGWLFHPCKVWCGSSQKTPTFPAAGTETEREKRWASWRHGGCRSPRFTHVHENAWGQLPNRSPHHPICWE